MKFNKFDSAFIKCVDCDESELSVIVIVRINEKKL